MSYIEDKVESLQDAEYRKALTYTAGSAAVTGLFGLASVERMLDGDIESAEQGVLMAGFSGTLTKGLYSRTQDLEEEITGDAGEETELEFDYDLKQIYSAD